MYSLDEPDQAPPPARWLKIGAPLKQSPAEDGSTHSLTWHPPLSVVTATIYYALDCRHLLLGIEWIQMIPEPQRWMAVPPKTPLQQTIAWLRQRSIQQLGGPVAAVGVILWIIFVLFTYWRSPLRLVAWHARMPEPPALEEAAKLLEKVGFGAFTLLSWAFRVPILFLGTSLRAMDARVANPTDDARAAFTARPTVFDRRVTLDLPMVFGETRDDEPWTELARPLSTKAPREARRVLSENVDAPAHLMSDEWKSFMSIGQVFAAHDTVRRSDCEYARGSVHADAAEGFNDRVRRTITGVFHHISPRYADSYSYETGFRWSRRVVSGQAVRRTRKGRKVAKSLWSRIAPALQLATVFRSAVGRKLRRAAAVFGS